MKINHISVKLLSIIAVLLLNGLVAQAQDNPLKMYIKYDLEHIADSTKKDVPIKRSMYLYITPQSSYFTSVDLKSTKESGSIALSLDETDQSDAIVQLFTAFKTPTKPFIVAFIGKPYKVYPKNTNGIDWKIGNEEKNIGGYLCRKAVGEFGGRTYEAWFTEEIPYSVGPWKLNGLPGAILEAYDLSKHVHFFYAGLDLVKDKINLFDENSFPEISYEKYKKSLENSKIDKMGALLASLPTDAEVKFTTPDGKELSKEEAEILMKNKPKDNRRFMLNNPVEINIK